jgi:hypothetical protein
MRWLEDRLTHLLLQTLPVPLMMIALKILFAVTECAQVAATGTATMRTTATTAMEEEDAGTRIEVVSCHSSIPPWIDFSGVSLVVHICLGAFRVSEHLQSSTWIPSWILLLVVIHLTCI